MGIVRMILLILLCVHFEGNDCIPTETEYPRDNDGITTETEHSDSWLIDWQTEVRLCGSDFNHLMENICGEKFTNEAESDYYERIARTQIVAHNCCGSFCRLKEIKSLCKDPSINGNFLKIPKDNPTTEPISSGALTETNIPLMVEKEIVHSALDKMLQIILR